MGVGRCARILEELRVETVEHVEHVLVARVVQRIFGAVVVSQETGRHSRRVSDAADGRTLVTLLGEMFEGRFANPRTSREIFECHGSFAVRGRRRDGSYIEMGRHSPCRSRRLNAIPPRTAAAAPMAAMIPFASQWGDTAGAEAIW